MPAVNAGVDRFADVHEHVEPIDRERAGETINGDLGDTSAVGEIKEGATLARCIVEVKTGCRIEATLTHRNTLAPGFLRELSEGHRLSPLRPCGHLPPLAGGGREGGHKYATLTKLHNLRRHTPQPRNIFSEAFANLAARYRSRIAVKIGTRRRGGRRGVVGFFARCRHHAHVFKAHAQFIGDDLLNLRIETLPHLGAAGRHLHCAVGVHVHQSVALVQKFGGE